MANMSDIISPEFVKAEFRRALEGDAGVPWVDAISTPIFDSSSASEKYVDLFDVPAMDVDRGLGAVGELVAKSLSLSNEAYAARLRVPDYLLRRDKTGQVLERIRDLARRVNEHWAKLISDKLDVAESTVHWFSDQFVLDTDHSIGDSGTLDNDLSIDISALPTSTSGSITDPSEEEAALSMLQGLSQFYTFKDTAGEPIMANSFRDESWLVMSAPELAAHLQFAATAERLAQGRGNPLRGMDIEVVGNARLSSWTSKFVIIRKRQKAFIRQQETNPRIRHLGEGSTYFETNKETHLFSAKVDRAVGYGLWQDMVLVTLT